jgi:hypothetical protein
MAWMAAPLLLSAGLLAFGGSDDAGAKVKKPQLELRAAPRFAFSPVSVLFTAELTGGDDVEEYYCPELEWEWDDGGRSVVAADCPPFQPGTSIERRFTATHDYGKAGSYGVKVTLKRGGRKIVTQTVRVTVRPGIGDRTEVQDN